MPEQTLRPETADQVLDALKWAVAEETPLEIVAGGSKQAMGRTAQTANVLDVSRLAGIETYEPAELYIKAGPATPMSEVGRTLSDSHQMLAFEPMDLGALLGEAPGGGTLGGVVACNLSGPRRIRFGSARDHLLGFEAASGRGETFKSGGTVVKNVTGFDLSKLMAGSYGTLAVMTSVTLKVLPAPEKTRTVLLFGDDAEAARQAMSAALGSAHEVNAAAFLPQAVAGASGVDLVSAAGSGVVALRVEGPAASVAHRCTALRDALGAGWAGVEELHTGRSIDFWREVRDVAPFHGDDRQVWRISVAPTDGPEVGRKLASALDAQVLYDWGGGLVWAAIPARADAGHGEVRDAVTASQGGHATLIRAAADVRAQVPVFQPQPGPLLEVTKRIKQGFDPSGVLNPGRMYAGV